MGFPGGSECKKSACNAEDPGLIPGSGRSPGEGNGYPFQYSCLGNPMDRGAWQATVHRVAKSQAWLSSEHTCIPPIPRALCPQHLLFREKPWNFLCGIRDSSSESLLNKLSPPLAKTDLIRSLALWDELLFYCLLRVFFSPLMPKFNYEICLLKWHFRDSDIYLGRKD